MNTPEQRLRNIVLSDASFELIAGELHRMKNKGVEKQVVLNALEKLRSEAPTESAEDRILEVMDLVSGFCSPDQQLWDD